MSRSLVVLAAVVLVAGCGSGAVSPSNSSPTPTPPVVEASAMPVPSEAPEPIRLLILGDSIAIPKLGCGSCEGFDQQYAAFLEARTGRSVTLANQARPNARLSDLGAVLDTDAAVQRLVADSDVIVVSVGYNNLPPWGPERPCPAPAIEKDADVWPAILAMTPECIDTTIALFDAEFDAVYAKIAELAGDRPQVRINLGTFDNLLDNPGGDGTIGDVSPEDHAAAAVLYALAVDRWNAADCAAATAHGFVCGDIHHAFNGPDGTGSVKTLVNPADFVHPNVAGQALIADLLEGIDISALALR